RGFFLLRNGGGAARVVTVSPGPLTRVEGQPVSIRCDVRDYGGPSEQDFEWEVSREAGGATVKMISTFDSAFSDASFSKRIASGDISVQRLEDNVAELKIGEVKARDAGVYICRTPSTDSIISGNYEAQVQLRVIPNTLKVYPETLPSSVPEGSELTLSCNVSRELTYPTYLSVSWLMKKGATSEEILTFGPQGDVTTGSKYSSRYLDGGVRLVNGRNGVFSLVISRVTVSDQGTYECNGTEWTHESGGKWTRIVASVKEMGTVTVTPTKPNFTLTLEASVKPQKTGEPIELSCDVTNISKLPPGGRLGVSWEHTNKGANTPPPKLIGSLDGYGNLLSDSTYKNRLDSGALGLSRVPPDTFKLRFLRTQVRKYNSIIVCPTLNIVAKPIRKASVGGATFEMNCTVYPQNLGDWIGYAVYIKSQEGLESSVKTIMSLSPDNVVQHSNPNRRDSLVLSKTGATEFQFRLAGVQLSDRGYYWCDVTAFTKQHPEQSWTTAANSESNKIEIDFQENGPSFSIAIHSDATSVYPWETAKMECSISVSGSSTRTGAYEVRWFFTRFRGDQVMSEVASVGRNGVMKKTSRNSSSDVSIERKNSNTYHDSGEYQCMVTPWYNSASSGLWTQAGELTSGKVFLSVRIAVAESLKLPLLYGAAASLGVGIFSLLLGLICAQCCCRNTAHTPRSRNKLLDLEMD
uniref:Prostaglandin F2 receptor inhibitor n=1 Tax=Cyprinodon variegatus TaxID=28743 RepID=A0A3Q2FFS3_CYPVA